MIRRSHGQWPLAWMRVVIALTMAVVLVGCGTRSSITAARPRGVTPRSQQASVESEGVLEFRRLVATASMRFPDDPTMRALILREADPSWDDPFASTAALELTERAGPMIALFDPPARASSSVMDPNEPIVWIGTGEDSWFCWALIHPPGEPQAARNLPRWLAGKVGRHEAKQPVTDAVVRRAPIGAEAATRRWLESFGIDTPRTAEVLDPIGTGTGGTDERPSAWRVSSTGTSRLCGVDVRTVILSDGQVGVVPATFANYRCAPGITHDQFDLEFDVEDVAWSHDGRYLGCRHRRDSQGISIIDVERGVVLGRVGWPGDRSSWRVNWVSDRNVLVVDTEAGVQVIDAATVSIRPWTDADPEAWRELVRPSDPVVDEPASKVWVANPDETIQARVDPVIKWLECVRVSDGSLVRSLKLPSEVGDRDVGYQLRWMTPTRLLIGRHRLTTESSQDWWMMIDLEDPSKGSFQGSLDNVSWYLVDPSSTRVYVSSYYGGDSRLWVPGDQSVSARTGWGPSRGGSWDWHPDGSRVVVANRYDSRVEIHDVDWVRRRDRLWKRIPAILTPMQRMQYLGESWPVAQETWKRQANGDREGGARRVGAW